MTTNSLLHKLIKPTQDDFFILDIDSTLVTTHQRNQAILEAWLKDFKSDFPEDTSSLVKAHCQFGDYGLSNALERVAFSECREGALETLKNYWRKHFFSNEYLHTDLPARGAVHWVQSLEEWGVEFVYLTARHKNSMWDGTLSSLDQMGFPIHDKILFLKEDLNLTDEDYKAQTMADIVAAKKDKSIWFIDNEPVVLHRIDQEFPNVNLVWFDSTHSGKKDPPERAVAIRDFSFSSGN